MTVTLPVMSAEQEASWIGLFHLAKNVPDAWTLVGGQMVHLHCAERGVDPYRSTPDVDTVLDVRAYPQILMTVTSALTDAAFEPRGLTASGKQHRWVRGEAIIDVLIPAFTGRAGREAGADGNPGLATPGAIYALRRTETVEVTVGETTGTVRRPSLIGALVIKSAAYSLPLDTAPGRHLDDIALLASMLTARDLRGADLAAGEIRYLRDAVPAAQAHLAASMIDGAADGLARLTRVIDRAPVS
ncbi:hypothetical protein CLV56_1710 [Mumia flava]|uniref:Nucleotidyltransferase AbiEii toxin of type IV toxin-antitoxin system n=1 Tax=Mumia flava TaxID=1348852 RepID=A0A2M9BHQ3_9ACTN|nr:hypothetical protein [Mumia flava]PJJ57478.1 hypothetical protein CLV56_1710 [Mumia flava]